MSECYLFASSDGEFSKLFDVIYKNVHKAELVRESNEYIEAWGVHCYTKSFFRKFPVNLQGTKRSKNKIENLSKIRIILNKIHSKIKKHKKYPVSKFQILTERSILHVAINGFLIQTSTPVIDPWW